MVNEILMYISNGLIIMAFLLYLIIVFIIGKKKITDSDGFNITKDFLSEYDQINIIENNGYFTVYNLKRKVIKIASKCYYGNSLGDVCIPLMEAGISGIDNNKNKAINIFRRIVSNLKLLYLLPIIAIGVNSVTHNISDAKVSIVVIGFFSTINYFIIDIKSEANIWISEHIKHIKVISKVNRDKVLKFINNVILVDKVIFWAQLIMLIRYVFIIIK